MRVIVSHSASTPETPPTTGAEWFVVKPPPIPAERDGFEQAVEDEAARLLRAGNRTVVILDVEPWQGLHHLAVSRWTRALNPWFKPLFGLFLLVWFLVGVWLGAAW